MQQIKLPTIKSMEDFIFPWVLCEIHEFVKCKDAKLFDIFVPIRFDFILRTLSFNLGPIAF